MQGASFWGTAGMPRVVGPPHGRRPAQYDLCPGWAPDPGHCGGSAPRSQPSRQPQSRPRVRPSGALQVWTRVGEGPQRRAQAQYDLCPGWAPDPGHWRYRTSVLQPPPGCAAGPRCVLMGHCGQGRADEGPPPARPLNTISAPDGPIDPGHCGYPASKPPPQSSSIRSLPQMAPPPRGTAGIVASQPSSMTHVQAVIHRATDPCGAPAVSRPGHRASKIRVIRRLDPGQ